MAKGMSIAGTAAIVLNVIISLAAIGLYVFGVYCFVRIFKKAGLGWWGLASIIPLMVLPLLMVLAFAEWPTTEK
jgi:hypothetical protein